MSDRSYELQAGHCIWCGAELQRVRSDALYCSDAHKQAHYRWRGALLALSNEAAHAMAKVNSYQRDPTMREEARKHLRALQDLANGFLRAGDVFESEASN